MWYVGMVRENRIRGVLPVTCSGICGDYYDGLQWDGEVRGMGGGLLLK